MDLNSVSFKKTATSMDSSDDEDSGGAAMTTTEQTKRRRGETSSFNLDVDDGEEKSPCKPTTIAQQKKTSSAVSSSLKKKKGADKKRTKYDEYESSGDEEEEESGNEDESSGDEEEENGEGKGKKTLKRKTKVSKIFRKTDEIDTSDLLKILSSLNDIDERDATTIQRLFLEVVAQQKGNPSASLSTTLAYDSIGSFIIENERKGGGEAKKFFEKYISNSKTYSENASPYEACGVTFLSPLFESERVNDIKDIERRRTGPVMKKGVVKCRKCKSKYTRSEPKQDRSGDEPMSFYHDCRMCGEHWKTSG